MHSNPFNCPPTVYRAMEQADRSHMAALWAARTLGPGRVQYVGRPAHSGQCADAETRMSWALDGRVHVTLRELLDAADAVASRRTAA